MAAVNADPESLGEMSDAMRAYSDEVAQANEKLANRYKRARSLWDDEIADGFRERMAKGKDKAWSQDRVEELKRLEKFIAIKKQQLEEYQSPA